MPPSVLWLDHATIVHGTTNIRTFATKNFAPPPDDSHGVRLCKYDTVHVTYLHVPAGVIPTADTVYAYISIETTHADDRRTGEHLRKGLRYLVETFNTAVQEALHPSNAPWPTWHTVTHPPETPPIAIDLHEIMMITVQAGWVNIRHTRARVAATDAPTDPLTRPMDSEHDNTASHTIDQHDPQSRNNQSNQEQVPHQTGGMEVRSAPSLPHSGHQPSHQ